MRCEWRFEYGTQERCDKEAKYRVEYWHGLVHHLYRLCWLCGAPAHGKATPL